MTRIGALYQGNDGCEFRVWAPLLRRLGLRLRAGPSVRDFALERDEAGYWRTIVDEAPPGSRYWYLLEGATRRPDPASHSQPDGVHGPSEVIDHAAFPWTDAGWEGVPLEDLVIYDQSAKHFIQELTERVGRLSRQTAPRYYLIGESDLNDVRFLKPPRAGGYGLDAQWCDDLHHSLHTLVTGEHTGYYEDFGSIEHLAKAFQEGFVYSWQFSRFRRKFHGSSSRRRPARQFVVFAQNHDQIGNRMLGERLSRLVDFESLKLAAGTYLLSPYLPLLFMGEEYGEETPFLYFVSHTDEQIVAAVRQGRRMEFAAFQSLQAGPDPQAPETFQQSKLRWDQRRRDRHSILLAFYQRLQELRRGIPHVVSKKNLTVASLTRQKVMLWHRRHEWGEVAGLLNFDAAPQGVLLPVARRVWVKILDSADPKWAGPGALQTETMAPRQRVIIRQRYDESTESRLRRWVRLRLSYES